MTFPDKDTLQNLLTTREIGRQLEAHDTLDSTNSRAKRLATEPYSHGMLIVANRQTAGRGRMTRVWQSPPDVNLYASIIIHPNEAPPKAIPQLALVAAVALHNAFTELIPQHAFGLKWPNDIWSQNEKKLSGILCEALLCGNATAVVIGIGVNVNGKQADFPAEIANSAGTLKDIAGHALDRTQLLAKILNHFEPLYSQWLNVASLEPFMDYWNRYDILRGKQISVCCGNDTVTGIVTGIKENGTLELIVDGKSQTIHAGDTHILNTSPVDTTPQ